MTHRATQKQPHRPSEGAADGSGSFRIHEIEDETILPPATEEAEEFSLEALGAMVESASLPAPPPEARGSISGVYTSDAEGHDEDLAELMSSLEPFYRGFEQEDEERVELDVRDLSLQPGNPFVASSLVPPPAAPFPWAKLAVGGVAGLALGIGAYVASALWTGPEVVPPRVAQPAASAPAQVVAVAAPQAAAQSDEVMAFAVEDVAPEAAPAQATETIAPAAPAAPRVVREVPAAAEPKAPKVAAEPAPNKAAPVVAAKAAAPATGAQAALAELLGSETAPVQQAKPAAPAAAAPTAAAAAPAADTAAPAAAAAPVELPALASLPAQPSREAIQSAVEAARPQLQQCAAGKHGILKLDLTVRGSGRVSGVLVDGVFAGTPEGSCMARAMRKAAFPQFSDPKLTLSYPLPL